jgi:MFS transporter, DHA1 family, multidrug resistance protein
VSGPGAVGTPSTQRAARVAFAVLFLSFVDVFALLPTVAPYASALGAGPAALGLVVGAYSAANLPANLLGGALVDRFGRRPVLLLGLVTAAVAVAAYSLASSPGQLVGIRLVHGAAGGLLVPAVFAVAGDHTARGGTGRTMGRAGALIGAAAVVAPASAGVLRQAAGPEAVFLAVAGLLLLGALLTVLGVRDAERAGTRRGGSTGPGGPAGAPRPALLRDPAVRRTLLAVVATTAAVGVLAGFLPGAVERRGGAAATTGLLFTVYALVAAGLMLSPLAAAVDREGPRRSLAIGLGLLAGGLGLLAATGTGTLGGGLGWSVVGVGVFGAGYGLIFPAASGAIALAADPERRGWAFGWFNVAFSLGIAVGAPVVGAVTERFPAVDPFLLVAGACLATAAATSVRPGPAGPRRADRDHAPSGR